MQAQIKGGTIEEVLYRARWTSGAQLRSSHTRRNGTHAGAAADGLMSHSFDEADLQLTWPDAPDSKPARPQQSWSPQWRQASNWHATAAMGGLSDFDVQRARQRWMPGAQEAQARALNGELAQCGSVGAVLAHVDTSLDQYNAVNAATAFYRIASVRTPFVACVLGSIMTAPGKAMVHATCPWPSWCGLFMVGTSHHVRTIMHPGAQDAHLGEQMVAELLMLTMATKTAVAMGACHLCTPSTSTQKDQA